MMSMQWELFGKIGTTCGAVATVATLTWKLFKNRKIVRIRRGLTRLGIRDTASLHEWIEQWPDNPSSEWARANEEKRDKLLKALSSLLPDLECQPPSTLAGRLSVVPTAVGHLFFNPYSLGSTERETLDHYSDFLLAVLRHFKTRYRAGHGIGTGGTEHVKLLRLLRLTDYGEVWLGTCESFRPLGPVKRGSPREQRVVHFLTKCPKAAERIPAIRDYLKQASEIDGVLWSDAGIVEKVPFVITHHARGGTLEQWLKAGEEQRVKLRKDKIMQSAIAALSRAHELKMFHRLITPASLQLTVPFDPDRVAGNIDVRIADFWMSLLTERTTSPVYQPTEPWRDDDSDNEQSAKNDVFALGVTWYQFLIDDSDLARPPYDFYDRLADDGREARDWIKRCLAYSDSRYVDATELRKKMTGEKKAVDDNAEAVPPADDYFDVSHLVEDFLATAV